MKRIAVVAILVVVLLSLGTAFAFENEPEGFRELKWGDPPTEDMELVKRFEDPDVCWYRRPNDELEIERARIEQIAYGFYENRLWRVHITAEHDFVFLTGVVKEKFGPEGHRYTFKGGWCYQWLGDTALVDLWWKSGIGSRLEIRSIKINSELQEDERRKKEERKDEKMPQNS